MKMTSKYYLQFVFFIALFLGAIQSSYALEIDVLGVEKVVEKSAVGEGRVKAWDIVKDLPQGIKLNTTNLEKLSRYIEVEGVDIAKLKSSLGNTADAQKWIDLKLPKSDLDDIYNLIKNDPPYTHPRWTPQHKAQRWKNYETGCANGQNACLDFESWSNGFDGKIDLELIELSTGRRIQTFESIAHSDKIDLSGIQKGIYVLMANHDGYQLQRQLVKL